MTHLGTFTAAALQRQGNRPYCGQPNHSLAHALLSGVAMSAFFGAALIWLAQL